MLEGVIEIAVGKELHRLSRKAAHYLVVMASEPPRRRST
jgi:hypothetical protein